MKSNPFAGLLRSRKFLLLVLDVVIQLVLYFVAKYATPALAEDIVFVIGVQQPVWVALIAAIAHEDAAAKKAGTFRY